MSDVRSRHDNSLYSWEPMVLAVENSWVRCPVSNWCETLNSQMSTLHALLYSPENRKTRDMLQRSIKSAWQVTRDMLRRSIMCVRQVTRDMLQRSIKNVWQVSRDMLQRSIKSVWQVTCYSVSLAPPNPLPHPTQFPKKITLSFAHNF